MDFGVYDCVFYGGLGLRGVGLGYVMKGSGCGVLSSGEGLGMGMGLSMGI